MRSADLIRIRIARIECTPGAQWGCTPEGEEGGTGWGDKATLLMYVYRGSPPRNMIQRRLRKGEGMDLRAAVVSKNTAGFGKKKCTIDGAARAVT